MGYSIIDIVDRSIQIENKKIKLLDIVINDEKSLPVVRVMGKVFINQCKKMILFYEEIKDSLKGRVLEEIDFRTYDKIAFLMGEFSNRIFIIKADEIKEYIHYIYGLRKDMESLFIDIQGRLVNGDIDHHGITMSVTYEILSKIISRVDKEVREIEKILNK